MNNLIPQKRAREGTSRGKMNKLGDGKIVSVYWFIILFLVAAAVVYMVALFYGNPYDVRGAEARALSNKITNCISQRGFIEQSFLETDVELRNEIDLKNKCNLDFRVEEEYGWMDGGEYYTEIQIYSYEGRYLVNNFFTGNINLRDYCGEEFNSPNFPICIEGEFYSLDEDGISYFVKITSIVRKTEKNVQ